MEHDNIHMALFNFWVCISIEDGPGTFLWIIKLRKVLWPSLEMQTRKRDNMKKLYQRKTLNGVPMRTLDSKGVDCEILH